MVTLDIDDALNNCGRFVNQNGSLDINQVGAQVCIFVIIEEFYYQTLKWSHTHRGLSTKGPLMVSFLVLLCSDGLFWKRLTCCTYLICVLHSTVSKVQDCHS